MSLLTLIREEGSLQPARIAMMSAVAGLSSAAILAVINGAAGNVEHHQPTTAYFFLFLGILVVYGISKRFILVTSIKETEQIVHRIRLRIIDKVIRSDLLALDRIGRNNISMTAGKETRTISSATVMLIMAAEAMAMLTFGVLYLVLLSFTAFVIGVGFTVAAVMIHLRRRRQVDRELQQAIAQENACLDVLADFLNGFKEVKVHSRRASDLNNHFSKLSSVATESKIDAQSLMAAHITMTDILYYMLIGTIVFVVPVFSASFSETVVKAATAVLFMFGSISSLVGSLPLFAQANAAANNIRKIEYELDKASLPHAPAQEPVKVFDEISFQNVTFEHHDAHDNSTFSIGPLNLRLRSGELVFITGGNGSGKSTLIKLLVGLYTPTGGTIRLDRNPVDESLVEGYRNMFSVIFSDFYLFDRLFGLMDASPTEIETLLRQLEIEDKTRISHGAFDTLDLSGGQRKRIALLVATLEDRPVIVLDEWAADQDPIFRKKFYEEIIPELKRKGKTIIAITHDDQYFHIADRQLKLEYGQIVNDTSAGHDA